MAEKKKTWWELLAELIEQQGPIRYQGTYDPGDPYYKDNRVKFQPVQLPVMFQPGAAVTQATTEGERIPVIRPETEEPVTFNAPPETSKPVQTSGDVELDWRRDVWNKLLYGGKPAGGQQPAQEGGGSQQPAGGGKDPYGTRKKGYESEEVRGEVGDDAWWYDMARLYDDWSAELQASWIESFGTPRPGNPYQVYPYWKYDQPYRATGGSNKETMFNGKLPQQRETRGLTRDKWGRWNTPAGQPVELSGNRVGNQMVTWRR